jgi:hypothetical protein
MERWSVAHRTADVCLYCKTKSIIQSQHHLRQQFNGPRYGAVPSCDTILMWICRFEDTGSVRGVPHGAPRAVYTEENVRRIREFFQHCPRH